MALLPAPDVYGYTIFCDEIRQEVTGKFIYIGVYDADMNVHLPFPATLSRFTFKVTLVQRRSVFVPNIGIRISLPGDAEGEASILADMPTVDGDVFQSQLDAMYDSLDPSMRGKEDERVVVLSTVLSFQNLVLKEPGIIKVRAVRGGNFVRAGALRVHSRLSSDAEPAQPSSEYSK